MQQWLHRRVRQSYDDSDSEEETFPEDARRLAREAQARQSRWEAHFEARRALIAQAEWQPAPPDLDPNTRVDAPPHPDGVTRHYNFRDYVDAFAARLKRPSVWHGSPGRAYTSTSMRIRAATIHDDAEFAATRLDLFRNQRKELLNISKKRSGDTARMRSEVGPKNASYMHAKTARVVDLTAYMYKADMRVMQATPENVKDGTYYSHERAGYMTNLPPDLQPFYEMELRCDPMRVEPAAWRVDITAKREPGQTIETSALCVCRPVTQFRVYRGEDNHVAARRDSLSFHNSGDAPAYVILTALRQRVFDSNGNELDSSGNERFNVDDYVVTTERYAPVLDMVEDEFGMQWHLDGGGPRGATDVVSFLYPELGWSRQNIQVLNKFPLMLEGDCFRNWKQLGRAVRSVGPALAEARERAAERVYAPDAAGARAAQANFERLAREQERENRRRRDREARQEEGQSPRRAPGTLPSLAALRV